MTSYEKVVVDAITSDSESEIEEVSDDNEDQSSAEEDPEDEQ